jgi:DNA-binding protein H-NS
VRLTYDNAMLFNQNGSLVFNAAKKLKSMFEKLFAQKNVVIELPSSSNSERLKEIQKSLENLGEIQNEMLKMNR